MSNAYPGNKFAVWLEAELRRRSFYPSLEKASRQTKIPKSQVSKYLRGEAYPSEASLAKLASALQVDEAAMRSLIPRYVGATSAAPSVPVPTSVLTVLSYGTIAARFFGEHGIAPDDQEPFLERIAQMLGRLQRAGFSPEEAMDILDRVAAELGPIQGKSGKSARKLLDIIVADAEDMRRDAALKNVQTQTGEFARPRTVDTASRIHDTQPIPASLPDWLSQGMDRLIDEGRPVEVISDYLRAGLRYAELKARPRAANQLPRSAHHGRRRPSVGADSGDTSTDQLEQSARDRDASSR